MWFAIAIIAVAVCLLAVAGCQLTRAGYESASYRVVRSDGKFELRDYPALALAETPMAGGDNGSFMRLFRFISGSNQPSQKISMTTPVFMSGSRTNATMAFVMPAKFSAANTPRPADTKVWVREFAAGKFAVLRFTGGRSQAHEAQVLAKLQSWMQAQGLKELSSPIYGYFDPPWTLPFMRRNEVMIRTGL
jgi:SOUL heme-binding protein